ncbi:MAG: SDR family NAD(P)-dependent oxidoreductase [Sandaracinus sp.]|nr:SDR family NAD(P)-dependent oxidoreductase [Sandaracinus sp.]MCB9622669.1 SDR family NAD(P)-dependent oxidoreductase [Sandaracinus sp.]MCB9632949.1 SDR family NAD(P)-dependent oxidoreductase [Sandaracinus sp.]
MKGRLFLVTGASAGIGLETAKGLAARGAEVWIVGRNPERTDKARASVSAAGSAEARAFRADFSSLADVRRLAAEVRASGRPLHGLVNNAGLWHQERHESAEGFEDTFAVNHLAPFLLTHLLLPALREGAKDGDARIVHVSSRLHEQAGNVGTLTGRLVHLAGVLNLPRPPLGHAGFDFDDLGMWREYHGLQAYARSKLAQLLFSNELSRRLAGTAVTSNAVHPGSVATEVTRESRFLAVGQKLAKGFLKTPEQGAATTLYVASEPSLRGRSGGYYADSKERTPAKSALSIEDAQRLWALSERMVDLKDDERGV